VVPGHYNSANRVKPVGKLNWAKVLGLAGLIVTALNIGEYRNITQSLDAELMSVTQVERIQDNNPFSYFTLVGRSMAITDYQEKQNIGGLEQVASYSH
jgi:hypothetical protein